MWPALVTLSIGGTMPRFKRKESRFIDHQAPLAELASSYLQAMLDRQRDKAAHLIEEAVDAGNALRDIYLQVFQPVQYEVGWLWQSGQITVGHEHYCTNATQLIMSTLYPRLFQGERGPRRMLGACVQGELHEMGMRMLTDFFEMEGWNTDYLGANTPREAVVSALEEKPVDLLAVGVTMHYHLEEAQRLIEAVRASRDAGEVHILVGGYTFRAVEGLWKRLGADGTAGDAGGAVRLANELETNAAK